MDLLVATRSAHKLLEIREILTAVPRVTVLGLDDLGVAYDPAEEGLEPYETFEENAVSKARYFRSLTGLVTVADDSGIEVDALDGAPGVRSKRFAPLDDLEGEARDRANNAHLLALLSDTPPELRTARYVCVAALAPDDDAVTTVRGEVSGSIVTSPRGQEGFGYDPLFFDPELDRTFGEISRARKRARSHRGRAFRALADRLASGC